MKSLPTLVFVAWTIAWPLRPTLAADEVTHADHCGDQSVAPEATAHAEVDKALATKIDVDFSATPLGDVIKVLSARMKVKFDLDLKALESAGIDANTPVTLQVKGVSLRSILQLMLKQLELTYVIQGDSIEIAKPDDFLVITTPDDAWSKQFVRVYDVADLIGGGADRQTQFEGLMNVITLAVGPMTWDWEGGSGSILVLDMGGRSGLVIGQAPELHEEISDLLCDLRKLRRRDVAAAKPDAKSKTQPAAPPKEGIRWDSRKDQSVNGDDPHRAAIETALETKIDVVFDNAPLDQVIAHLREMNKSNLVIDVKDLELNGFKLDMPVNYKANSVSVRTALNSILRRLELTYVIRDEVVQITTPDEAEALRECKVYDIQDLVDGTDDRADVGSLVDMITSLIQPSTWNDVGGDGTMAGFSANGRMGIVVTQTSEVQAEVSDLLRHLRKTPRDSTATSSSPAAKSKYVQSPAVIVYKFEPPTEGKTQPTPAEVATAVRAIIAPKTWNAEQGLTVVPITGGIVVQQTDAVHREVAALLNQLDVMRSPGRSTLGVAGALRTTSEPIFIRAMRSGTFSGGGGNH